MIRASRRGRSYSFWVGQNIALSRHQRCAVWPLTFPADTFLHTTQHPPEGLLGRVTKCCTSPFYRPKILTAILTTISSAFDDNFDDRHKNIYSILQTLTAKTGDVSRIQKALIGTHGNLEKLNITVQISLTPPKAPDFFVDLVLFFCRFFRCYLLLAAFW